MRYGTLYLPILLHITAAMCATPQTAAPFLNVPNDSGPASQAGGSDTAVTWRLSPQPPHESLLTNPVTVRVGEHVGIEIRHFDQQGALTRRCWYGNPSYYMWWQFRDAGHWDAPIRQIRDRESVLALDFHSGLGDHDLAVLTALRPETVQVFAQTFCVHPSAPDDARKAMFRIGVIP